MTGTLPDGGTSRHGALVLDGLPDGVTPDIPPSHPDPLTETPTDGHLTLHRYGAAVLKP